MLSLGITSAEWNDYSPERMKAVVDDRVDEYNRLNTPREELLPAREPEPGAPPKEVRPAFEAQREEKPAHAPKAPVQPTPVAARPVAAAPVPARRKSIQEPAERFNAATASGNEGRFTKLSIAAFVCSVLGCTVIIGIILGTVDLIQGSQQGDNRKKGLSIAAIAVGAALIIFGSVFTFTGAGQSYIDMITQRTAVEQPAAAPAETEAPEEEAVEEPAEETTDTEETDAEEPAEDDADDTEDADAEEDTSEDDTEDTDTDDEELVLEDDAENTEDTEDAEDAETDGEEPEQDATFDDAAEEEGPAEEVSADSEEDASDEEDTEEPREEETSDEKHVPKIIDDWSSQHATAAIAAASIAANSFLSDYQMSLAPQNWSLAKYDDTDTVLGITEITYNGKKGYFIYVGTLQMNDAGKIQDATTHYLKVNGEVMSDDGYCEDVSATISELGL
ncbi:MAG: DUF4190 domain-containing protein [Lachnospiraceae bacterium]|nr:DUF4190 domain-containing protein [Lachnospiraceae bacterium]